MKGTRRISITINCLVAISMVVMFSLASAQPPLQLKEPIKPTVPDKAKPSPIRKLPDLVVLSLIQTGPITSEDRPNRLVKVTVPVRVVVKNQGNAAAGRFQVAAEEVFSSPGSEVYPRFVVPGLTGTYVLIDSLAAGAERTLTGSISFSYHSDRPPSDGTVSLVVIADSSAGMEFPPDYIMVRESNEDNNMSPVLPVLLPRR